MSKNPSSAEIKRKIKPFTIKIRDFDKDYKPELVITNHEPTIRSGKEFSEDGVYSSRIFGSVSSFNEYSCVCGVTQGEYLADTDCPVCKTKVVFNPLVLEREGWIDLGYKFIHPYMYPLISSIIGPTALRNILDYKYEIENNGVMIKPTIEYPYYNIGITEFINHFDTILNEYYTKKRKHTNKYNIVRNNRSLVFITKFPVKNKRLRPAMLGSNFEISYDVVNNYYNGIISCTNILKGLTEFERNMMNVEKLKYITQMHINSVYKSAIDNIRSKYGVVRCILLGNRSEYCSRMVITPLDGRYEIDDLVLPYNTVLELLKPLVIRYLADIRGINLVQANNMVKKAHRVFNQSIYDTMCELIKDPNLMILINRNPSINIGSILMLRIKEIKKNMGDKTASIHNAILKPMNGDYDGDGATRLYETMVA